MKNTILDRYSDTDSDLHNVVFAQGPGDGILRMQVVVEDATSISNYGRRQVVVDFSDAVDLTDLTTKANAYLAERKDPVQEVECTYVFDPASPPAIDRGDTLRVVSQRDQINITAEVQELDWGVDRVKLHLGNAPDNIINLIQEDEDDDDKDRDLGLPVPIGFRAETIQGGIRLFVNPFTNSRAIGVEIHVSATGSFTPDNDTLMARGAFTQTTYREGSGGTTYYFQARSYDAEGNVSDFTDEINALFGYIDGGEIAPDSIDSITPFADTIRPVRIYPTALPSLPQADVLPGDYATVADPTNPDGQYGKLWIAVDTDDPADGVENEWQNAISPDRAAGIWPEGPTIAVKLNTWNWSTTDYGELYIHGFDSQTGAAADVDGYVVAAGQTITVPRKNGSNPTTVYTSGTTARRGILVIDSAGANFTMEPAVPSNTQVVFAWKEGGQWYYDDNSGTPQTFTPDADMYAIGSAEIPANPDTTPGVTSASVYTFAIGLEQFSGFNTIDQITEGIIASYIAAGAITATQIKAGTIDAGKMVLGSFDNLIQNPSFDASTISGDAGTDGGEGDPHYYSGNPAANYWGVSTSNAHIGSGSTGAGKAIYAYNVTGNSNTVHCTFNGEHPDSAGAPGIGKHVACQPGDQFYFSVWVRDNNPATTGTVYLQLSFCDKNGGWLDGATSSATATTGAYVKREVEATAPTNAVAVIFRVVVLGTWSAGAAVYMDTAFARQLLTGELIVDGSIKANHIDAEAVVAGKVAAGAIGADQIAANAIKTHHLQIGGPQNLLVNPSFDMPYDATTGVNWFTGWAANGTGTADVADDPGASPPFSDGNIQRDSDHVANTSGGDGAAGYGYSMEVHLDAMTYDGVNLDIVNGAYNDPTSGGGITCFGGERFVWRGWFKRISGTAFTASLRPRMGVKFTDADGTNPTWLYADSESSTAELSGMGSTWEEYWGYVTTPDNRVLAFPFIQHTASLIGTTRAYRADKLSFTRVHPAQDVVAEIYGDLMVDGTIQAKHMVLGSNDNLIQNPSFEQNTYPMTISGAGHSAGISPDPHAYYLGSSSSTWRVTRSYYKGGRQAIYLNYDSSNSADHYVHLNGLRPDVTGGGLPAHVAALEGDKFYFSFWTRDSNPATTGTVKPQVIWWDGTGTQISSQAGTSAGPTGAWVERTYQTEAAPAGTVAVSFLIVVQGTWSTAAWVAFDNVFAKRMTEGASLIVDGSITANQIDAEALSARNVRFGFGGNLLKNPSWDYGSIGDIEPGVPGNNSGWYLSGEAGSSILSFLVSGGSFDPHTTNGQALKWDARNDTSGTNTALYHLSPGSGSTEYTPFRIPCRPGEQFHFSVWAQAVSTISAGKEPAVGMVFVDKDAANPSWYSSRMTGITTSGWNQYSHTATAPAQASYVTFYILVYGADTGPTNGIHFLLDDAFAGRAVDDAGLIKASTVIADHLVVGAASQHKTYSATSTSSEPTTSTTYTNVPNTSTVSVTTEANDVVMLVIQGSMKLVDDDDDGDCQGRVTVYDGSYDWDTTTGFGLISEDKRAFGVEMQWAGVDTGATFDFAPVIPFYKVWMGSLGAGTTTFTLRFGYVSSGDQLILFRRQIYATVFKRASLN